MAAIVIADVDQAKVRKDEIFGISTITALRLCRPSVRNHQTSLSDPRSTDRSNGNLNRVAKLM